jgi:transposase
MGDPIASTLFVGIDAHQDSLSVAVLPEGAERPERAQKIPNDPKAVRRHFSKLLERGAVRATYEAGCTGFVLLRQLTPLGIDCLVAAPSRIPVQPGERRKTDRLDAERLALFLRGGQLTRVSPPTPEIEALRTLTRTRDKARRDMVSAKHQVTKLLLNRGVIYRGKRQPWSQEHRAWLRRVEMPCSADQDMLDFKRECLAQRESELERLDERIALRATCPDVELQVRCLEAYRGVGTLIAVNLVAELGDVRRFASKPAVASFFGLVPGESSSGKKVRRQGITRTGSKHVRRLLVQSAQHYLQRKAESKALREQRNAAPASVRDHARKTERRLVKRYRRLAATKHTNVAKAAIARELVGHLWASIHPEYGLKS